MPADLVIKGGGVVPDPITGDVIENGFVAIEGGRIAAVDSVDAMDTWDRDAAKVIDATGRLVLPGIVNAHTHVAAGLFRGILEEGGAGLHNVAFPMEQFLEPDDIYWLGLSGLIEVIKNGCTTVNDIFYYASSLAKAADEVGLRAVLAEKMFDADFTQIQHGRYERLPKQREEKMRLGIDLIEQWNGARDGRITCRMGTHATDTCSKEMLQECREEANRLGVGLHIHTAQSQLELDLIQREHGCTPVEYLDDLGYLQPSTISVHCTLNSDSDCARMAETSTSYAHCPTVYPRRGTYPRLWDFLDHGMVTGFGTDWMFMDPWEGARSAMYWTRGGSKNPDALPARRALDYYRASAANILGVDAGSLHPGLHADVILLDVSQPHLSPFYGNIPALVYNAHGSDVVTSIVNGELIMDERTIVNVDEHEVVREVQRRAPRYLGWYDHVR